MVMFKKLGWMLAATLAALIAMAVVASPAMAQDETVAGTDQTYTVRPGDTLFGLAQAFQVELGQLLAANPQIVNPNSLVIGQVLQIPNDNPSPAAPAASVSPSTAPAAGPMVLNAQGQNWTPGTEVGIWSCKIGTSTFAASQCAKLAGVTPDASGSFAAALDFEMPRQGITVVVQQQGVQIFLNVRVDIGITNPYTVQPGDTLRSIASAAGISLQQLLAYNPSITNPNVIVVGQQLYVLEPPPAPPRTSNNVYVVQAGDTLGSIAAAYGMSLGSLLELNDHITNANVVHPGQLINVRPSGPAPA